MGKHQEQMHKLEYKGKVGPFIFLVDFFVDWKLMKL
jgi:hypothetical protein